ncbi:transglutaminase-like cysteine peptidase [Acidicapsa acidisoli]|uniref:transglutaminase-like cysteine peptidase n=1 Tax=Acidicapsa acidisoli TaxID=1615681 RepID=UPI0021DF642A|nr:transglutaminase-like cysteine peptidase [Acidicapsa acidisoli]
MRRLLPILIVIMPLSCPAFDMDVQLTGWTYATQLLNAYPIRTHSLPIAHFEAKLDEINREINRIPYANDEANYHEAIWQTPVQFSQLGGECRDYVVAKYSALYTLGVADADMQFVGVRIRKDGRFHAILLVSHGGRAFILDNRYPNVRPASAMADYEPLYYINRVNWRVAQ